MQKLDGYTWRWLFKNIHPLFLPLLYFVLGLLLSHQLGGYSLPYLFVYWLLIFVNVFYNLKKPLSVFFIGCLFVLTGVIRHNNYNQSPTLYSENTDSVHELKLTQSLGETEKTHKFIAKVENSKNRKTVLQPSTKVMVYLKKTYKTPTVGQTVFAKGILTKTKKPTNPHQFDYSNYLAKKRIFYQIYSSDYQLQKESGLVYKIGIARKKWSGFIEKHYKNKAEIYAGSLILADNTVMGKAERELFSKAGIAHLFALSGLHVGIVFGLLLLLLSPFSYFVKSNRLQLIALLFVWLFVLFANWQPSVVRASFMLSLFVVSRSIQRPLSVFDTLTVSAFFLLLFNPNWLWDVGFQLSFVAVFFISCSVNQFAFLMNKKSKIQNYLVGLLLVSATASIATAPLTMYYFHHFSWIGLLVNLILVPIFPLVMVLSAITVVFSSFGVAPDFWIGFSNFFLGGIDWLLQIGISLQGNSFSDLSLLGVQVVLAYCLFLLFYIFAKDFKWNVLILMLLVLITFHSVGLHDDYKKSRKKEWVFFDANKDGLILHREGFYGKVFFSNPKNLEKHKKFILENYKIKEKIKKLDFVALPSKYLSPLPQQIFIKNQCVLSINSEEDCDMHYTINRKENFVFQKDKKPWDIKKQGALIVDLNPK